MSSEMTETLDITGSIQRLDKVLIQNSNKEVQVATIKIWAFRSGINNSRAKPIWLSHHSEKITDLWYSTRLNFIDGIAEDEPISQAQPELFFRGFIR